MVVVAVVDVDGTKVDDEVVAEVVGEAGPLP